MRYTVLFKRPKSNKLKQIAVIAADEIEASKKANDYMNKHYKGYNEYGISKGWKIRA